MMVEVITTNLETQKSKREIIDHDNRDQRVWLGRHCFWAMRNNHEVTTRPVKRST